jgi:hypothetical protein
MAATLYQTLHACSAPRNLDRSALPFLDEPGAESGACSAEGVLALYISCRGAKLGDERDVG